MSAQMTASGVIATILLTLMEAWESGHSRTAAVIVGVVFALPVPTWLPSPGVVTGSGATSGLAEGLRTRLDAWLPAQSISHSTSRRCPAMIWTATGADQGQPRPSAQKETDELTKRVLKGKTYAAWQNTPGSVSRPHLR